MNKHVHVAIMSCGVKNFKFKFEDKERMSRWVEVVMHIAIAKWKFLCKLLWVFAWIFVFGHIATYDMAI